MANVNQFKPRIRHLLYLALLIFNLLLPSFAKPQQPYPFPEAKQTQLFTRLIHELRCVVCQNQSLADSSAPIADDLRHKIYQMILANKSEPDIKYYLQKRYGEFILLRPSWNQANLVLWLFPILACVVFFSLLVRICQDQVSEP